MMKLSFFFFDRIIIGTFNPKFRDLNVYLTTYRLNYDITKTGILTYPKLDIIRRIMMCQLNSTKHIRYKVPAIR